MGKKNRKKQTALLQESVLLAEDHLSETSSNSGATFKETIKVPEGELENEDVTDYNYIEDKIDKALEDLSHKNITLRENALNEILKIFQLQYVPEIIEERQVTISSLIERSIKKGQSTKEQILGATLVPIFFIQIFCTLPTESFWQQFEPILLVMYKDNSSNIQVREACLLAHSFCVFALESADPAAVERAMDELEACFRRRSPKFQNQKIRDIDDPLPLHLPDDEVLIPRINSFRKAALLSWSLLLTVAPANKLTQSISKLIPYLNDNLLDNQSTYELRVPTAQCLAVCYELDQGREGEDGPTFLEEHRDFHVEICGKLRALTGENAKFIAKRDQRLHRSIFRQVLGTLSASLEDTKDKGDAPLPSSQDERKPHPSEGLKGENVKFGSENLQLATWVGKLRYDTFCQILGPGINNHLKENEMLRQIFDLGPAPDGTHGPGNKLTKEAKHKRDLEMASTNKARTLSLQKARRYKNNAIQLCVEGE